MMRELLYIARITRPNISIQENQLEKSVSKVLINNLKGTKASIKYLIRVKNKQFKLQRPTNLNLDIFTNSLYRDPLSSTVRLQSIVICLVGE